MMKLTDVKFCAKSVNAKNATAFPVRCTDWFGAVAYDVQHIDLKAGGSFFDTVYYAFLLHF